MEAMYALTIGAMSGIAIYLMLSGHFIRFLFGVIILGNAVNLAIFSAGRLSSGAPAFIPAGQSIPLGEISNALPQALILTAIVIGFGLLAFSLGLCYRMLVDVGEFDLDKLDSDEVSSLRRADEEADL